MSSLITSHHNALLRAGLYVWLSTATTVLTWRQFGDMKKTQAVFYSKITHKRLNNKIKSLLYIFVVVMSSFDNI